MLINGTSSGQLFYSDLKEQLISNEDPERLCKIALAVQIATVPLAQLLGVTPEELSILKKGTQAGLQEVLTCWLRMGGHHPHSHDL